MKLSPVRTFAELVVAAFLAMLGMALVYHVLDITRPPLTGPGISPVLDALGYFALSIGIWWMYRSGRERRRGSH